MNVRKFREPHFLLKPENQRSVILLIRLQKVKNYNKLLHFVAIFMENVQSTTLLIKTITCLLKIKLQLYFRKEKVLHSYLLTRLFYPVVSLSSSNNAN